MLNNIKSRKQEGFTIIEVLIVLAIAGLIMLVVFLAVPALQRNQRNQGRRSDASRIATSANDFITDSNGSVPTSSTNATALVNRAGSLGNLGTLTGGGGGACNAAAGNANGFNAGQLVVCKVPAAGVTFALPSPQVSPYDGVIVATSSRCNGPDSVTFSSNAREMSVVYTIEVNNTTRTLACIDI